MPVYFCSMKKALLFIFAAELFVWACNGNNNGDVKKDTPAGGELPKEAIDLYKAIKANPDSGTYRLQLAYMLDSINQAGLAIQQMDTIVMKDSTSDRLWSIRGHIAEDAKDTMKAMESYAKSLRINEAPGVMLSLANLYAEKKNPRALLITSRIKDLSLGKEYDANSAFIAGIYYARTGDKNAALQKFDESIANNYTFMEAYIEKGMVYFDNKQYPEALKVFKFASTVNNLYADAYYYQARCYEMTGNKDSAVMRFKQSLGLDKNLAEAHAGLKRLGAE